MRLPTVEPSRASLMIKPVGAACNLRCEYCYYLPVLDEVYGGKRCRMSFDTVEAIFRDYLPHAADEVTISWQGGEPTLAGLDFFKAAVGFQQQHKRPGQRVANALQTNGTLLDDDWCAFLKQHAFLIGISVDGSKHLHDHYRHDAKGGPTHARVAAGLRLLRKHGVEHNVLCVLNDQTVKHPRAVYEYITGKRGLASNWVQFIPAIEWVEPPEVDPGGSASRDRSPSAPAPRLADFCPDPGDYGRFFCEVFDLWWERDRGKVSVRLFDTVLGILVHGQPALCQLAGHCHGQITIESSGDVFGCDHFVDRRWQLGRVGGQQGVGVAVTVEGGDTADNADTAADHEPATPCWLDALETDRLAAFSARKQDLPHDCDVCDYRPLCHGGCPKHRPHRGDVPEPTILCESYKAFYAHALMRLQYLGVQVANGRA